MVMSVSQPREGPSPHQMLGRLQQHPAPLQQHAARRGELGPVAAAVEQHGVQPRLPAFVPCSSAPKAPCPARRPPPRSCHDGRWRPARIASGSAPAPCSIPWPYPTFNFLNVFTKIISNNLGEVTLIFNQRLGRNAWQIKGSSRLRHPQTRCLMSAKEQHSILNDLLHGCIDSGPKGLGNDIKPRE